jgi:hypothetical protein
LFHDFGGTIVVVGWWFAIRTFVQRWILIPEPSGEMEDAIA